MCPACIATVALIVAGASSTGGAAALFMKFRMKKRANQLPIVYGINSAKPAKDEPVTTKTISLSSTVPKS
jgi:hypothetical protein